MSPLLIVFTLDVLVISSVWLLTKSFVLLVVPNFLSVTLTTAAPLALDRPLKVTVSPPLIVLNWSSVNVSVVPSG